MDPLDFSFCFLPIIAEFDFAAHATLIACESFLVLLKTVDWLDVTAIAHRSESNNTNINTDRCCCWRQRWFNFSLSLDRYKPLCTGVSDGHIFDFTQNVAAVSIAHPTKLGEKDTAIALIELASLRIAIAV